MDKLTADYRAMHRMPLGHFATSNGEWQASEAQLQVVAQRPPVQVLLAIMRLRYLAAALTSAPPRPRVLDIRRSLVFGWPAQIRRVLARFGS
eukprot:6480420-Pyramimonas_sp.AAC.1